MKRLWIDAFFLLEFHFSWHHANSWRSSYPTFKEVRALLGTFSLFRLLRGNVEELKEPPKPQLLGGVLASLAQPYIASFNERASVHWQKKKLALPGNLDQFSKDFLVRWGEPNWLSCPDKLTCRVRTPAAATIRPSKPKTESLSS